MAKFDEEMAKKMFIHYWCFYWYFFSKNCVKKGPKKSSPEDSLITVKCTDVNYFKETCNFIIKQTSTLEIKLKWNDKLYKRKLKVDKKKTIFKGDGITILFINIFPTVRNKSPDSATSMRTEKGIGRTSRTG